MWIYTTIVQFFHTDKLRTINYINSKNVHIRIPEYLDFIRSSVFTPKFKHTFRRLCLRVVMTRHELAGDIHQMGLAAVPKGLPSAQQEFPSQESNPSGCIGEQSVGNIHVERALKFNKKSTLYRV